MKYAVIVAGGSGTRMGGSVPKQFMLLHGKPVLWHTLNRFLCAFDDVEIIVVVPAAYEETALEIVKSFPKTNRFVVTIGGQTRFHSVKNGLEHVHKPSIVFVHDAVRCLVSTDLIHRCYYQALETGNAIPAVQPVDSIRIETARGNESIDRSRVKLVQTPQTFSSEILKAAFKQEYEPSFTDEASLSERLGIKLNLVDGERTNIKITGPLDMLIAETIMQQNHST